MKHNDAEIRYAIRPNSSEIKAKKKIAKLQAQIRKLQNGGGPIPTSV
jgi:hypothetical protein